MGRGMLHQRLLADGSHNTCMPPLYADVSALCLTSPFSMAKVPNPKLGFGSRDDDEGGWPLMDRRNRVARTLPDWRWLADCERWDTGYLLRRERDGQFRKLAKHFHPTPRYRAAACPAARGMLQRCEDCLCWPPPKLERVRKLQKHSPRCVGQAKGGMQPLPDRELPLIVRLSVPDPSNPRQHRDRAEQHLRI